MFEPKEKIVLSPKLAMVSAGAAAAVALGAAFAMPAFGLTNSSDPDCPDGAGRTCSQDYSPPRECPQGTVLAPVQTPGDTTCTLDALVQARASAELLTHDQLIKLCADVRVRHLVNVRIAVGHPHWEIITLDDRTCAPIRHPIYKDCWTAEQAGYHDVPRTDPRYDPRLDMNHDGIACETTPATAPPVAPPAAPPTDEPIVPAPVPAPVQSHLPVTH
jgi:Excalibur calcium-binding domain